ncbi:hypothetical protein HNP87_001454 [Methanococcus maripaludis]|uniref:Uncharacterized protein n=1 Tax=Methanococcus maripaludis TaxID=39152 RepID=A0A7J9NPK2_METMI|nr:hypothetical protein [Methanococcus maripaludis]
MSTSKTKLIVRKGKVVGKVTVTKKTTTVTYKKKMVRK